MHQATSDLATNNMYVAEVIDSLSWKFEVHFTAQMLHPIFRQIP